jgi:hypothetical protein
LCFSQGNLFWEFLLIFQLTKANKCLVIARRNFLAKKKKPGKRSPASLLSPEEQLLLDQLLEKLETLAPAELVDRVPSPAVAERLVESLPLHHQKTPEFMAAIGTAFPHKTVLKALKKKRFRLGQKGIQTPPIGPETALPLSLTREEAAAYVGPIDGVGCRPVWIVIPQQPSGVALAMGVINDTNGIVDFVYEQCSRKKMKEIKEIFFSKAPYMVETSLAHVTTVLERAYLQEKERPGDQAGEYLRLRPRLLQLNEVLDRPAVSDAVPMDNINPDMVTETQIDRLFRHDLMAAWTLDLEKIGFLVEDIARAEASPIFISEGQRREHISKIKEDGLSKIFGDRERRIFRDRLQETAYVFVKIGEEALARSCLEVSLSLDAKDSHLKVNPFVSALLERSLAQFPKPERSSSLILR